MVLSVFWVQVLICIPFWRPLCSGAFFLTAYLGQQQRLECPLRSQPSKGSPSFLQCTSGMLCLCHVHSFFCCVSALCLPNINGPGIVWLHDGIGRCLHHCLAAFPSWLGWSLPLFAHIARWAGSAHATA